MAGESTPNKIGKLKRSCLLHYIDASFGGATPNWFLIGKHIEDMSVELNPDTQSVKNILDETVIEDNGYEPSISADPYYANTGDAIYDQIRDIAMNRLTGDDCKTKVLEDLILHLRACQPCLVFRRLDVAGPPSLFKNSRYCVLNEVSLFCQIE